MKRINNPYQTPIAGSFALNKKNFRWVTCKEQFLALCNKEDDFKGFYYCCGENNIIKLKKFIAKIEKILNLKNKSNFLSTNKKSIAWIEPCLFWKTHLLKFSLLLILLKNSLNYNVENDNLEECLFGEYSESFYTKQTKNSLMRFMFGFTEPCFEKTEEKNLNLIKNGWFESFKNLSKTKARSLLKKENNIVEEKFFCSTLWD